MTETLQRKIEELESDFKIFLSLPLDRQISHHKQHSQDIAQRIFFLKHLLSAETSSNPENPRHLHHIDKRLAELENSFHEWEPSDNNNLPMSDGIIHLENSDVTNNSNNVSKCCCNETCRNESDVDSDDNDDDGRVWEYTKGFMEGSIRDNPLFEDSDVAMIDESSNKDVKKVNNILEEKTEEKNNIRRLSVIGKYSWVVVGVALMGFAAIVKFSSCQRGGFPTPT
ncbi:hypothetical protein ACFE04_028893 [Oxalis oulophora]